MLASFHIKNFRGCPERKLNFGAKTYIMGPNGSGKTHILEGIHILARGDIIYNDSGLEEYDSLFGIWQSETGEKSFSLYREVREQFQIQGEKISRLKYRSSLPFRTVFVSPFDMNLLYFAPSMRRDYLDNIIERTFEQFSRVRRDYETTMRQRNALLKNIREGRAKREDLDFWDKKFASLSEVYLLYRKKYIDFVKEKEKTIEKFLPEYQCSFFYISTTNDMKDREQEMINYLKENRERDILTGHTHIGPHRDDFIVYVQKGKTEVREAQRFLSRGEVKLLLLSLKLIEVDFLSKYQDTPIILLVDDIFAELDEANILRFLKSLTTYQSILTSQKPLPVGENWNEFTCINLEDI